MNPFTRDGKELQDYLLTERRGELHSVAPAPGVETASEVLEDRNMQ